jgi:hypothetical protein
MLKLRDGWKTLNTDYCTYLYAPDESTSCSRWYVEMNHLNKDIYAYPKGARESVGFDIIEEAHAYFLSVGSESPWEESC